LEFNYGRSILLVFDVAEREWRWTSAGLPARRDDPGTGELVAAVVSGKVRSEIGECWQVGKVLWGGVRRD